MKHHNNTRKGRTAKTAPAPIKVAQTWLATISPTPDKPLIDVSQAAPTAPPHPDMLRHMSQRVLSEPSLHRYGPILGNAALRQAMAAHWTQSYQADISNQNVAITSGCNQAFCAVVSAIADQGDNIILPRPWYFNHNMWLEMNDIETRALACNADMLPNPDHAASLIDANTKAICLVTPNNPTGVEYPSSLLDAFYDLARKHGIKLILDETYKDFRRGDGPPHRLVQNTDALETVIQLYSFSKVYRLMGHRIGAIITSATLLNEIEKFLDTVTICATPLGQDAALFGLEHLTEWVEDQRQVILSKQSIFRQAFTELEPLGWRILGCGAYFAYVSYPFDMIATEFAQRLVEDQHILALPSDMFVPVSEHGKHRHLRIAFANIDQSEIEKMVERLTNLPYRLAPSAKGA